MKTTISACVFVVAMLSLAATLGAGADDDGSVIASMESAWVQAEMAHDARALEPLLADTFVNTDDDGSFMDRTQWLAHVGRGDDHYQQLAVDGQAVRVYGNAAVVTGRYHEKIEVKGKVTESRGRFTDVWVKQSGTWKCVASQSTLAKP